MTDKCIVSFACKGRENYPKAQLRMVRSCAVLPWDGDYIIRCLDGDCDEYSGIPIILGSYPPPGDANHAERPYGFKVDIVKEAIDSGHSLVGWMDSTAVMVRYPRKTIAHAKQYGVAAFHNLGHDLWPWISDVALKQQELTEAVLRTMQQIMACVVFFDVSHPVGAKVFDEWYKASRDGCSFQNGYGSSREGFRAHRHDQAVLSCLLFKHNIPLLPYGLLVYEPHDTTGEFGFAYEFINKAIT